MSRLHKRESEGLIFGDVAVFIISLWLTLAIRYAELPSTDLFYDHIVPFTLLFVVWVLVFFIVGLYERHILFLKNRLPGKLAGAHVANILIALVFFYAVEYFGITPKGTLFLYLLVSALLLGLWRLMIYPKVSSRKPVNAIIIGKGSELQELHGRFKETGTTISGLDFIMMIDPAELNTEDNVRQLKESILAKDVEVIAIDLRSKSIDPLFSSLYDLIFSGVRFVDIHEMYEDLFDREPLGLLDESWFIEHISLTPNFIYDTLKRLMDIVLSVPFAIVSLIFYPFVWIAIKIQDGGPIFIYQERVGENNKPIYIIKFRSMNMSDDGYKKISKDEERKTENKVTKVGKFLRKSRIDELPQLWNVIRGDVSLIGPRPELPKLVEFYNTEIPYYNVRHLIKPGLSGWAQIHHEVPPHSVEETKVKLAYDLYYLKHRSFPLDLKIALQTIKTLLSRTGI